MLDIINSYKFARISDVVFSEDLSIEQFYNLELPEIKILEKHHRVKYLNLLFEIKDNDIIFCETSHVKFLFKLLKNLNLKNITLITSQSDIEIDSKFVSKLPKSIKSWYCINSSTSNSKLKPIPIGIANEYEKNLSSKDFKILNSDFFDEKEYLLYVNFNINTNRRKRAHLYDLFKNNPKFLVSSHNTNKIIYKNNIMRSSFVLCPEGNGINTHRFWETIYLGSIPVVEERSHYESFRDLPVLVVDKYDNITNEVLLDFLNNNRNTEYNLEKLNFEYWNKEITKNKQNTVLNSVEIKINYFTLQKYLLKIKLRISLNKTKKLFIRYYWKLKKLRK